MVDLSSLKDLSQPDRVDRRVYTDPAIFDLEMERIFGRVWLYLGHESQLPTPNSFFTTKIGRENVVISRDKAGVVRAFYNRCPHRGALVCAERSGTGPRFVCPYHAWTFGMDGQLVGVPHKSGYGDDFAERTGDLNLEPIGRLDIYNGFIFGSRATEGPDLQSFLGTVVREALDNFVDRSPVGRIEVADGKLVQAYRANWKLQIENSIDLVHPPILHRNAVEVSEQFMKSREKNAPVPTPIDIFRSNGLPFKEWDEVRQFALDHGHCYMEGFLQKLEDGDIPDDERFGSDDQMRFENQREYKQSLVERHGREKAEHILAFNRHNTIIYPNLFINPRLQQVRVLHPVSVNHTEQHCYVFRLVGAPEDALHQAVAFLTASNSPSSIATTDDHEIFERIQDGLESGRSGWVDLSRGYGSEEPSSQGLEAVGTSELAMRNQHKAWREYMLETA